MSDKTVERFEPYVDYSVEDNGEPDMRPAKDGDWRRNEDYERLESGHDAYVSEAQEEYAALEKENAEQAEVMAKLQSDNKALREVLEKIADGDDTAPELMRRAARDALAATEKTNG